MEILLYGLSFQFGNPSQTGFQSTDSQTEEASITTVSLDLPFFWKEFLNFFRRPKATYGSNVI